jgi:hypothetical protein
MVMFVVVELTHLNSNLRFDVCVIYLRLIILSVVDDVSVNSDALFDRLRESQDQVDPVLLFDRLHEFQDQANTVFQMCS